ncbi:hypothetical protein P389DRAFT_10899 [Cystobasidium minutum MCA 4210]|uniref:uncharacterized protein n=1 Tax=Cystobasidium minutum MCA 4210 TaxID=1397322 RepID=UPI0034CFC9B4|eukprot:jgi/Rhomi1/10899/CE10898_24
MICHRYNRETQYRCDNRMIATQALKINKMKHDNECIWRRPLRFRIAEGTVRPELHSLPVLLQRSVNIVSEHTLCFQSQSYCPPYQSSRKKRRHGTLKMRRGKSKVLVHLSRVELTDDACFKRLSVSIQRVLEEARNNGFVEPFNFWTICPPDSSLQTL